MGIAALEDKIVQQAVVTILNQIYEVDFKGFSYGFRPGRSPHQALDALTVGIQRKHVNWVLDADIRGFFDNMSHEWTMKFVEHRVADRRILRLIQKWLKAGISEDGQWSESKVGTPQGAVVSPLLAMKPVADVDAWLRKVVNGYHRYHAVPGNIDRLSVFGQRLRRLWWHSLRRRSQRPARWDQLLPIFTRWLPAPRVLHPYPTARFLATHPRWEPYA